MLDVFILFSVLGPIGGWSGDTRTSFVFSTLVLVLVALEGVRGGVRFEPTGDRLEVEGEREVLMIPL